MMIAGALAILTPAVTGIGVMMLLGWLLIGSGVLHLVFAWRGGHASAVIWEILLGILYGGIGFYIIGQPLAGLASVTFAIAGYLLLKGVLEFVVWMQLRRLPGTRWLLSIRTRRAQRNFPAGLSQFQTRPAPCSARKRPCAISLSRWFKESSVVPMFRWA